MSSTLEMLSSSGSSTTLNTDTFTIPLKAVHQNVTNASRTDHSKAEDFAMLSEANLPQPHPPESHSRPISPATEFLEDLEPPPPEVTAVDEAESKVFVLNSRRDVYMKEKALAESRMMECNASHQLYKIQFALADQKIFDVDMEMGRTKNELAMARRNSTTRTYVSFSTGRQGGFMAPAIRSN